MEKHQDALTILKTYIVDYDDEFFEDKYLYEEFKEEFDILQELVDKEVPKKGIKEIVLDAYDCDDRSIDFEYEIVKCPNCNFHLVDETENWDFEDWNYCPNCGQALDWSDE
jgi:hypothetical protein